MYFCYILYSKTINQTYTGVTTNLKRRLKEHKEEPTRTTKRADDYKLVWYAEFRTRELAEKFEIYLKTKSGRAFMKKRLVGGDLEKMINSM
jgi:predicted GIY-YIG superfamily endonuclease